MSLSRIEKSLLIYLETRIVDHFGIVDTRHMNDEDMNIAEKWDKDGFITFKRLPAKYVFNKIHGTVKNTHSVWFSEDAWIAAHKERRNRGNRMLAKQGRVIEFAIRRLQ